MVDCPARQGACVELRSGWRRAGGTTIFIVGGTVVSHLPLLVRRITSGLWSDGRYRAARAQQRGSRLGAEAKGSARYWMGEAVGSLVGSGR